MRHQLVSEYFENAIENVVRFWCIVRFASFNRLLNFIFRDKRWRFQNNVEIIKAWHVDEINFDRVWKKKSDKNRILNSKYVITSKALFSASCRERFKIFDVFFDLWFRIRAQRIKRQRLDDESQMMRKICLNSIFFFFAMISVFSFDVFK
jgi:hypothetical protein